MFLHGIGGGALGFKHQLEVFARAGFRAVAWDMPGYGRSDPLEDMTFPALADAMLWLVDQLSVDTVHAVGHSIGGMVVQEFACHHQSRLASMVLAQTSPAFGNPSGDFQKKFVADRLKPLQEIDGQACETYIDWFAITFALTMTSCPVISLPCGFTADGLPVGLQVVGPPRDEAGLLTAAKWMEALFGVAASLPINPRKPND
jgi:pimeloyl-ACP methyl ester carboxylesterase